MNRRRLRRSLSAQVSSVVCLLPVYVVKYVQRQYFPTLANDLRYLASLSKERRTKLARESNFTSRYSTTISSTDEFQGHGRQ